MRFECFGLLRRAALRGLTFLSCVLSLTPFTISAESFLSCTNSAAHETARCRGAIHRVGLLAQAPLEMRAFINPAADDRTPCPQHANFSAPRSIDYTFELNRRVPLVLHRLGGDDIRAYFGFVPKLMVLQTDQLNAFAFPSGTIAFTRGLLAQIRSDDELAFVLAHELGHLVLHHHSDPQAFLRPTGAPTNLLQREVEADAYAIRLLHEAGFDTAQGLELLERTSTRAPSHALEVRKQVLAGRTQSLD